MLGEVSSADYTNLLPPFPDADWLLEDFELTADDVSVLGNRSAPWHPAWADGVTGEDFQLFEPLDPPSHTDPGSEDNAQSDVHLAYHAGGLGEAPNGHSSVNGSSAWQSASTNLNPPGTPFLPYPTDVTTFASSSYDVWSTPTQSFSTLAARSQQIAQAGGFQAENTTKASTLSSCAENSLTLECRDRSEHGPHDLVDSITSGAPAIPVSVGPSNNDGAARPHVCLFPFCGASFPARSGLR